MNQQEEISSKRRRLIENSPMETLKLAVEEVEKKLQSATEECEWWKCCAQGLCKHLDHHFAELPINQSHWHQMLNEEPTEFPQMQLSTAYIKKAAKIIQDQKMEIENFNVTKEDVKKLEAAKLALLKALEMEQKYTKSAEERIVNLETQLVQVKSKEEENTKLESANLALNKELEMAVQYREIAEARTAEFESQLLQLKTDIAQCIGRR